MAVRVLDRKGNPIAGLTKSDFELNDNERPRPIATFSTSSNDAPFSRSLTLVLLVDSSGSIAATVGQQRSAAKSLVSALGDRARFAVMEFSTSTRQLVGLTADKEQVLDAMGRLRVASGGTAILDAILDAFNLLAGDRDLQSQKIVLVLSDGLDNASRAEAEGCIQRANELGASVYGVQIPVYSPSEGRLVPRPASRVWLRVIEATGGRIWRVGGPLEAIDPRAKLDLAPVFYELIRDLSAQYLLGFYPDARASPGYHALKVRVKTPLARRVHHRLGYWRQPASDDRRP